MNQADNREPCCEECIIFMLWAVFSSPCNTASQLSVIAHTSNWIRTSGPFLWKGVMLKIISVHAFGLIINLIYWSSFQTPANCCLGDFVWVTSPPFHSTLFQEKSQWWIHQLDQTAVRVIASQPCRRFFRSSRPCENWCRFKQVRWPVPSVCTCDKHWVENGPASCRDVGQEGLWKSLPNPNCSMILWSSW